MMYSSPHTEDYVGCTCLHLHLRTEVDVTCPLHLLSNLFIRQGLSLILDFASLTILAGAGCRDLPVATLQDWN